PNAPAAERLSGTSRGARTPDHLATRGQRGELQRREQIIALQVRIISKDLLNRHPRRKEFQQHLHGIPQPADYRLPMAYLSVRGDPVESRHTLSLPSRGNICPLRCWHAIICHEPPRLSAAD